MDLRHLRYFLCVAEEMHFGRAALRLGISQPPLSQQIRALEEELGVQLFERTSRRVALTEVGRLFVPEAKATLVQAERAAQTARLAQMGQIGHLSLGFTASGPFVPRVAGALHTFRQSFPNVELTLLELGRDEQIDAVERRQLDVAIVRGFDQPYLPDGLISVPLIEEEMFLAIRQDHRLAQQSGNPSIEDLKGEPMVLYSAIIGAGFNEHFFALCETAGFRPIIAQEAGSLATLLGLVAAGFGATILAQSLTRLHIDNLAYRSLATPVISRLWLVHRHDLSPTSLMFKQRILAVDGDEESSPSTASIG
ncbi:LysR substrate-binding domain-containing protein [Sphingobium sp. BYY-5]|uniref:LysR substrate-binding domain-containing protein n=1 Tax=Sphingobium sp. BYY-5 TaxID=2926400 RepID=UPI001FA7E032|nr:LysR substrate-binding domain-containing protein [Sphingobium sp. BYY-5]MCI4591873.1 LysR substrate-binding domain-containing protein [Sphingobium sp. BYY-5]